jgi:hypothetical protein
VKFGKALSNSKGPVDYTVSSKRTETYGVVFKELKIMILFSIYSHIYEHYIIGWSSDSMPQIVLPAQQKRDKLNAINKSQSPRSMQLLVMAPFVMHIFLALP